MESTHCWERCVPSVSSRAYGGTSIPSRFTCPDPKKRDYSPWEGLTSRASSPPPFGVILSRPRWQQRSCAPSGATVFRRRSSSIHNRFESSFSSGEHAVDDRTPWWQQKLPHPFRFDPVDKFLDGFVSTVMLSIRSFY
ncbi:hypothetical protein TNCV_4416151 [Trichonephila clavipes]|uniref:Uncharacterized protein n=1 Tax=Trichonephila clavipes TaxID=2585209 RepID=A0A8X6S0D5_TRICX|nr:hypothetical protein TNCV_4416151 [Trichonephila clavipes]